MGHDSTRIAIAIRKVIKIALLVLAIIGAYWFFAALSYGQDKNWPMPPDLLNARPSCELLEYESGEVLNAKTQEVEQQTRWRVIPVATYADHRPRWTLPDEPLPTSKDSMHPGAIADIASAHEAIDTCQAWMKAVKVKAAELRKVSGNTKPKGEVN